MRLRTFTAPDMPTALKMVRDAMGEDAIILSSETQRGQKGIIVRAAQDGDDEPIFPTQSAPAPSPAPLDAATSEKLRSQLYNVLRFHNFPEHFFPRLYGKADPRELASLEALHQLGSRQDGNSFIRLALEKTVGQFFEFSPLAQDSAKRLMLVGPPGMGKTLTTAKLAARLALQKKPVAVFTTDNKRAGGVEQLKAFTDILGIDLKVADSPTELAAQLRAVAPGHHVLVDTAGGNAYDPQDMKEISQLSRLPDIEPVLTLACGGDSMEAMDIGQSFASLPIRRLLITRTDSARRFGGVLAVAAAHKLAFCEMSSSASTIDPLRPMDGAALAQLLLRYQLQTPST